MKHYFAPMEGITGYQYRNAHHAIFNQIDKYFTPFISPTQNHKLSSREKQDLLPEHNQGLNVVPQILTNHAGDFIWAARELKQYGYREVNLNLGCPSGTVVAKKKGAGFLGETLALERFLEAVFDSLDLRISAKIRIGVASSDEFYDLIEIFNRFPFEELIIHPRIRTDYYKNKPNLEVYKDGIRLSKNPVCYNGDIFTVNDYRKIQTDFPETERIMMGRGLIANPALSNEIRNEGKLDKRKLKEFHDRIYHGYQTILSGERNTLFKMKELWFYMIHMFSECNSYVKKIRKAERFTAYEAAVSRLFEEQELEEAGGFPGS